MAGFSAAPPPTHLTGIVRSIILLSATGRARPPGRAAPVRAPRPRSPRAWLSARRVHKGVTRGSAHGSAVTILKFLILFGEEPALASEGSFVPVSLPPRAPSAAWRVPGPPLGAHGLAPPPPALGLPLRLCGCLCRSRLPRRPGTLPRSTAPPSFLAPLPLSLTAPRPSARTTLVALPRAPLARPWLPASATTVPPNPAFRPPRVFSLKHRASRAVGARGAPGQSGRAPKAS